MTEDSTDRVYQAAIMMAEGKAAEAEAALRRALDAEPNHADGLHLLATVEIQKGNLDEAARLAARAADVDGGNPQFHNTLGRSLEGLGRLEDAERAFRRGVELSPDDADLHFRLGETLRSLEDYAGAEACYRKALALMPDHVGAGNGLGVALDEQGRSEEAEACFRRVLDTGGEAAEIRYNLGNVLKDRHRADEALAHFQRAVELEPGFAEAHVQLAFTHFLGGDYLSGWPEYEWRWRVPTFTSPVRDFDRPAWDGGALDGRTVLLHAEQGYGDTLQFARYAGVAAGLGGAVVVECQPALAALLRSLPGAGTVVARGDPLPPFDCQAPLLSVPGLVGTTLETIPADVPYLWADPALCERWAARFADRAGLKVGIAWQGTAEKRGNPGRACPLSAFRPLLDSPDIGLYCLQKDVPEADRPLPDGIEDLSAELGDFSDTAAAIGALDLVVSIDTAVAHLAGALGQPTWLALSTAGDWRWMMNRDDSPWYPTMRLFRQTRENDWDGVLADIAAAAARFSPARG